jgi:hypothetical protein
LSAVNTGRLFVYSGLLALFITGTAFAGRYQQTKDGKTRVWNENPQPGDLVTWSGARDAKGYATGYGTVTWFRPQKVILTGSNIARERHYTVSRQVSGTMVHGKLEEAPTEPKKKERARVSEERRKAPAARTEPTAKPEKPAPTPAPEKAASATATPSPTVTPSPTPASDSLDSLMHAPSSLKLNPPAGASPIPSPSATGTPDISLQLAPAPSPSPSPQ